MRAEIARIQNSLGTTTIYVTHDQVEAMTMGDRVAVIRKGMLQQVDTPQALYEHPVNIFVAGFIGSPAMNLLEARLSREGGQLAVEMAGFRLPIPEQLLAQRPDLKRYAGRTIVLGIRPEDMEDASLVSDAPVDRLISATIELREALGSDVNVHFTLATPPAMTEDVKELVIDVGHETLGAVERKAEGGETNVVARLNPRTRVHKGDQVQLVVDTTRLHFFDPADGSGIYGSSPG
jgi:multiple sugar transport system ATP-binding protein